jgi:hypothetical protein
MAQIMKSTRAHHVTFAPFLCGLRLTIEPILAFMSLTPKRKVARWNRAGGTTSRDSTRLISFFR